jgi:hypothetical protein
MRTRQEQHSGVLGPYESSLLNVLTAVAVYDIAAALDGLVLVQSPKAVPNGKHWVVMNASVMISTGGTPETNSGVINSLYLVNASKITGNNGLVIDAGLAADSGPAVAFIANAQAIAIPSQLTSDNSNCPIQVMDQPWLIVPAGFTIAAFIIPPATGGGIVQLSFSYFQRDNNAC